MARITKREKSDGLYKAILMLKTEEEVYNFFQDLCTITELRAMEQRFEVASPSCGPWSSGSMWRCCSTRA